MNVTLTEKPRRKTSTEMLDEKVEHLAKITSLESWTSFIRELKVPADIFPALQSMRPELLVLMQPRAMTVEESGVLLKLIANLIETNCALREHAERVAQLTDNWAQAFKHLYSVGGKIQRFANFERIDNEDE